MKFTGIAMLRFALVLLPAALPPATAAAGIKCWTNNEGIRECGNAVPPEYAQKAHREITETGITVSTTERAKTKEELRKEREEEARLAVIRAEEQRKKREREAKDRVLLSTFTTENELKLAHEGQVKAIDVRIGHTEKILKQLEQNLEQLRSQAAALERSGKPITPELKSKIAKVQQQMQDRQGFIESRLLLKEELAAQFTADLDRYRELKGISTNSN
jgi:hypothetical protein